MEDRRVINDSFYCCRYRTDGPISVMSTTQYVMAEYDERTGDIRWQRVVNASQRESVHNWLRQHFPVKTVVKTAARTAAPAPTATRRKQAAA